MGRKAELREAPVFPARAEDGLREMRQGGRVRPELGFQAEAMTPAVPHAAFPNG